MIIRHVRIFTILLAFAAYVPNALASRYVTLGNVNASQGALLAESYLNVDSIEPLTGKTFRALYEKDQRLMVAQITTQDSEGYTKSLFCEAYALTKAAAALHLTKYGPNLPSREELCELLWCGGEFCTSDRTLTPYFTNPAKMERAAPEFLYLLFCNNRIIINDEQLLIKEVKFYSIKSMDLGSKHEIFERSHTKKEMDQLRRRIQGDKDNCKVVGVISVCALAGCLLLLPVTPFSIPILH